MAEQRRGKRIAMDAEELDGFLTIERTCRVATVRSDGRPHVTPLWFAWDGEHLWLYSITRSQRWTDLQRDPNVAVVVDAGVGYGELRGVELSGAVEPAEPGTAVETIWATKYGDGTFVADGLHSWLRVRHHKIVSWDFRKMGRPAPA